MHTNSLLKSDRDEAPEHAGDKTPWRADEELRARLAEFRDLPGWSNSVIAHRIGGNAAQVSRYLNPGGALPHGDMAKFERKAWDLIRNETRRRNAGVNSTECEVSAHIAKMLDAICANNAIGEILGPSGTGKTRGLDLFCQDHPNAVRFTAYTWARDVKSVESTLFSAIGNAGYDGFSKRAEFMCKKMMGANRAIIVDNGEYLTNRAIHWLYDFAEVTQSPLAFLGTYALAEKLESDERRASRTFLRFELKTENPKALIQHLIKELAPDAAGETGDIYDLCEQIVQNSGHFRSVHQQLKLAGEMRARKKMTWVQAIKSAHAHLIRNYELS